MNAPLLSCDLNTPGPAHTCAPNEADAVRLLVHNLSDAPLSGRLELHVHDINDQRFSQQVDFDLAPDTSCEFELSAWDRRQGWFLAHPVATIAGKQHQLTTLSWVCMQAAGITPNQRNGFRFSCCAGALKERKPEHLAHIIEACAAAGIDCLRSDLRWQDVQPQAGDFDEDKLAWIDEAINAAAARAIELQAILCYNTKWAADPSLHSDMQLWQKSPPDPALWERYVRTVLDRFGDRIRWWEIWNEADITHFWRGSYAQYAELLAQTHALIKQRDPSLRSMTSGFATIGEHGGKLDPELELKVARDCQQHFDVFAHHQHGAFGEYQRLLDEQLQPVIAHLAADKDIWFNETSIGRGRGYQHQAATLVKKLTYARATCRAMGYTWYTAVDGDLDCSGSRQWGLLSTDYQPFAVYAAYNTLVRLLRDTAFAENYARGPGRHGYRFTTGTRHVLVLWDEDAALASQVACFAVDTDAKVQVVDIMGNATAIPVHKGRFACDTPRNVPHFVVVTNSTRCEQLDPLLDLGAPAPMRPGHTHVHPISCATDLVCTWPAGIQLDHSTLTIAVPTDTAPTYREPLVYRVAWSLPDAHWHGHACLPIRLATVVPAGAPDQRAPDITLASEQFVTNRFRYVPNTDHLTWQGPDDLSLRAWFKRSDDLLTVELAVCDSEHCPESIDGALPEGDCGEVILAANRESLAWIARMVHRDTGTELRVLHGDNEAASAPFKASSERKGTRTLYRLTVDLDAIDCTAAPLLVNLAAWDRDGEHRRGWIQLVAGDRGWTTASVASLLHPVVFA
ncbi:MAG: hypothetical protein PF961_02420 [Planctomycetota bacterium]|jgi:hypothetical protein|nr:hypothetical protein [Planctomycetota bacterium]